MGTVVAMKMKGIGEAPKAVQSKMDTMLLTPEGVAQWRTPPFQRPIRMNARVHEIAERLKHNGGILDGVLTLGVLNKQTYVVDGQHRLKAFELSGLSEGIADVRVCSFVSMAEMGDEFIRLNSAIVKMRPDDILRGLEGSSPGLARIRQLCSFIGYDNLRRGPNAPIISAARALRAWHGSTTDVPTDPSEGAAALVARTSVEEAERMAEAYQVLWLAWGPDKDYARLWSRVNLVIVMWLWNHMVVAVDPAKTSRVTKLTKEQFKKGLVALTGDPTYLDWLFANRTVERDRSACYNRVKAIMTRRLLAEMGRRPNFPAPPWLSTVNRGKPVTTWPPQGAGE